MGIAIQRTTRDHPLAVPGIVNFGGSRVFPHPRGRFQYVQVPGGGARKNDSLLGHIGLSGISLDSGNFWSGSVRQQLCYGQW